MKDIEKAITAQKKSRRDDKKTIKKKFKKCNTKEKRDNQRE